MRIDGVAEFLTVVFMKSAIAARSGDGAAVDIQELLHDRRLELIFVGCFDADAFAPFDTELSAQLYQVIIDSVLFEEVGKDVYTVTLGDPVRVDTDTGFCFNKAITVHR